MSVLNPPASSAAGRKFNAVLQSRAKGRKLQPLTAEEEQRWFSYDAFLDLLGLVNINLEDSGGLYALHCHMNHSCEPNVQVSGSEPAQRASCVLASCVSSERSRVQLACDEQGVREHR